MDYSIPAYMLVFAAGFAAGIVNTLAGGASVLTLAVLLFFGMPVTLANGTNRLGILVQNVAGSLDMYRSKQLNIKAGARYILPTLIGAIIGAFVAVDINEEALEILIGIIMTGVLFLVLYNPKKKYKIGSKEKPKEQWWVLPLFFAIGFYGGFVQVGTAVILLVALFRFANMSIVKANGIKMFLTALYTFPVLAIFILHDQVEWGMAILLAVGQVVGTWFTGRYINAHPKASIWVRHVLISMITFSILKSFSRAFHYVADGYNWMTMQIQMMLLNLAQLLSGDVVRWLVLAIMLLVIVGLLLEWMRPARLFLFASILLVMIGAVDTNSWLQSFANKQIATIGLLVAITAALQKNFNIEPFFDRVFRKARTGRAFLWRMSLYVAGISSFMNNTPVVAFMAPYIYNWSKRLGIHPSKLLIPLSFSTILGGMITVIGTSTNLVLNGFIERSGLEPLRFQDFFFLGISVTAVGIIYLYTWGYQLLPENREAFDDFKEKAPEYTMEAHVGNDSAMIGKTVMEAGLMALNGAYLIEVIREGNSLMASPTLALQAADALIFIGKTEAIMELVNGGNGLRLPMQEDEGADIVEAVIPANSGLAGQYVINEKFKQQLDAKVVALHRNGEKISGKMENVKLAVGDLLLLSVGGSFFKNLDAVNDLYVLSKIERPEAASEGKNSNIFLVLMACILGGLFFQAIDLFTALLFIMAALLGLNLYSVREMKRVVDADLIILLACALTIGDAIIKTGAADLVARGMISVLQPFGVIAIMIGLFTVTVALTSFVTNVAAVSVMFPIAFSITTQIGIDGRPLFVLLAFAASAAFLTPVGYQTNWMVYGPGGYTPKDFLRVGGPLLVLYAITCFIFVITYYGVY